MNFKSSLLLDNDNWLRTCLEEELFSDDGFDEVLGANIFRVPVSFHSSFTAGTLHKKLRFGLWKLTSSLTFNHTNIDVQKEYF